MRDIKFRGKNDLDGWVYGDYIRAASKYKKENIFHFIISNFFERFEIHEESLGQYTGLKDINGREIYEGDITELDVDGEIRRFVVKIKTVIRDVVSHPSFYDETAKVAITGVVFEWNGFDLFPCIDEKGISDNAKMAVVGNIYENPELLDEVN